jgi:hypothetical protein
MNLKHKLKYTLNHSLTRPRPCAGRKHEKKTGKKNLEAVLAADSCEFS